MLPFRLVYHHGYDLRFGEHVFPSQKYRLVHAELLRSGFAEPADFAKPEAATDEDILLVHAPDWVHRLKSGTLTYQEVLQLEIPYSRPMVDAFWLMTGGTILSARLALRDGLAYHIGGGFHHGFADHGEGFCAINDIAVAIRRLQKDGAIRSVLVLDCDVHHGNGTAAIFAGDPAVFTLSIHQFNNYPSEKPPSSLDIHLADQTGDEEYLRRLTEGYDKALSINRPDLIIYVAGADPFREDQLGGLALSMEGLKERDRLAIRKAVELGIPLAIVLAGGYAVNVHDTVTIHANTAKAAREVVETCRIHGR